MIAPTCASAGPSTAHRRIPVSPHAARTGRFVAGALPLALLFALTAQLPAAHSQRAPAFVPTSRDYGGRRPASTKPAPLRDLTHETQTAIVSAISLASPCVVGISAFGSEGGRREQSGVVIDGLGFVVTAAGTLRRGEKAVVMAANSTPAPGRVVGVDERFQLAVIKVQMGGLNPIGLRSSRSLRAGMWLAAIGRPPGYDITATVGTLSARDREIAWPGGQRLEYLIQTDAVINAENNGGPLVDTRGRLAGIALDLPRSAEMQGIGFAVPSEIVRRVSSDLIRRGKFLGAWYGIGYRDARPGELRRAGVSGGILVERVYPGTPAQRSGVASRDVIFTFNGKAVKDRADFRWRMIMAHPGDKVRFEGIRRGRRIQLKAVLGTAPEVLPRWGTR